MDRRRFVRKPKGIGTRVREHEIDDVPRLIWVSIEDDTRKEGDEFEDRAAMYSSPARTITANADFCMIDQMTDYLVKMIGTESVAAKAAIKIQVKDVVATALTETVMTVESLAKHQATWSPVDKENALSEIGLTAAVLPKFYALQALKREVKKVHKQRGNVTEAAEASI